MASARLTFDQASELLIGWYFGMRVDFLEADELDWELESRSIVIDDNISLSQKRKWLRDSLKAEKGNSTGLIGKLKGDVNSEIRACIQKFAVFKEHWETINSEEDKNIYTARLLHLGARIVVILSSAKDSPNLHSNLQTVLVDLVGILAPVFENSHQYEPSRVTANQEVNEEENGNARSVQTVQNERNNTTGGLTVLSQEDLDWIHSLQARIVDLEFELQRRKGKEIGTQTTFDNAPLQEPATHNYPSFPWSLSNPQSHVLSVEDFNRSQRTGSLENRFSNAHSNPPANTTFPIFNQNPNPNLPTIDPVQQNPSFQSIPNQPQFSQYPSFPNPNPPNQYSLPYQTRHTLPVSKWNIAKYSGDDQGLKLNEFLEHVQALSQAERVSDRELFESAVHLFAGSALKWYMSQRSTGRLMNWQHLVFELRRTYMHPDLDALIKMKIYQRRQQKHESFHEFYFEMEKLFRTMSCQIPNVEKMQIIQQNMRIDYKRQMTFLPIADLETLVAAGQKLDALNFSAYNKVFGVDRTVQAVNHKEASGKNKQKGLLSFTALQESDQIASVSPSTQYNSNRNNRPSNPSQNSVTKPNTANNQPTQRVNTPIRSPSKESSPSPRAGPSGTQSRPILTLEEVVSNHAPPPNNTCYNCGRFGHHTVMCRQPRGVFCSTCGLHGFPTDFCPYCIKNGLSANKNRRPQNN